MAPGRRLTPRPDVAGAIQRTPPRVRQTERAKDGERRAAYVGQRTADEREDISNREGGALDRICIRAGRPLGFDGILMTGGGATCDPRPAGSTKAGAVYEERSEITRCTSVKCGFFS